MCTFGSFTDIRPFLYPVGITQVTYTDPQWAEPYAYMQGGWLLSHTLPLKILHIHSQWMALFSVWIFNVVSPIELALFVFVQREANSVAREAHIVSLIA